MKRKLEILFVVYKAAMWDCMDSIRHAASADPDCNVTVVSIPYYELNEYLNPCQVCIEQLPPDVDVTPYMNYDIAENKPDIIYVHNPYDKENFLTSVHPDYYSCELKQHTNMLVYVNYGIYPSEPKLSSWNNFDKIIFGNDEGCAFFEEQHREKIVPLGSPKFDRMLYVMQHKPALPDKIKRRIKDKKVIGCPLSLLPFLEHSDVYLDKLRAVFDSFAACEDLVLWLRPHPLTENCFKSLRPHLWAKYRDLISYFKKKNIGIFDELPDFYTLFAYADGYYGDYSSVALLFALQSKPMMFIDFNIAGSGGSVYRQDRLDSFVLHEKNYPGDIAAAWISILKDTKINRVNQARIDYIHNIFNNIGCAGEKIHKYIKECTSL